MALQSFGDIEWPPLLLCALMLGVFPFVLILVLFLAVLRSLLIFLCQLICGVTLGDPLSGNFREYGNANGATRTLVVLMHGYSRGPRSLRKLRDAIAAEAGGDHSVHVLIPALKASWLDIGTHWFGPLGIFSVTRPEQIVGLICGEIVRRAKTASDADRAYSRIALVGHSLGAILMRNVYLSLLEGEGADDAGRSLRGAIQGEGGVGGSIGVRLVLLSGTNRGFTFGNGVQTLSSKFALNLLLVG